MGPNDQIDVDVQDALTAISTFFCEVARTFDLNWLRFCLQLFVPIIQLLIADLFNF